MNETQYCQSWLPYHEIQVFSEHIAGKRYTVYIPYANCALSEYICTCPSWKYRGGQCKHQAMVAPCLWEEEVGPERQTPWQQQNKVCPRCGRETAVKT